MDSGQPALLASQIPSRSVSLYAELDVTPPLSTSTSVRSLSHYDSEIIFETGRLFLGKYTFRLAVSLLVAHLADLCIILVVSWLMVDCRLALAACMGFGVVVANFAAVTLLQPWIIVAWMLLLGGSIIAAFYHFIHSLIHDDKIAGNIVIMGWLLVRVILCCCTMAMGTLMFKKITNSKQFHRKATNTKRIK